MQTRIAGFESASIEIGPRSSLDRFESLVLSIGILAALASPVAFAQQNVDTVVTPRAASVEQHNDVRCRRP